MPEPPEVVVYSLPDQVADKVCAMFERHGETDSPSSRFRDLLDLALIVSTSDLDGRLMSMALTSESRRRTIELPTRIGSPGPNWPAGYAALANRSHLPERLHSMTAALKLVGACLNPILIGERTSGSWRAGRYGSEGWGFESLRARWLEPLRCNGCRPCGFPRWGGASHYRSH
jgi:hypothetical protein